MRDARCEMREARGERRGATDALGFSRLPSPAQHFPGTKKAPPKVELSSNHQNTIQRLASSV